ncbi:hypothetical protein WJX72_007249 [[Myrmecia] bisecta]|uniref:TIR domain-containing protein n=1 Tax=[Myrmecia] bisecta TaxID=41462 RepID=A0AAW1PP13_9CHLO
MVAMDPAAPSTWDNATYKEAVKAARECSQVYYSDKYSDAYTTIRNFRLKHGGENSLQYADDFLTGNMTAEEYKLVDAARKVLLTYWKDIKSRYKLCELAGDDRSDFFEADGHWLRNGTSYRVWAEPLDIANWYKGGNHLAPSTSGHYVDHLKCEDEKKSKRPSQYAFLERIERDRLPVGAAVTDSTSKAAEYKRLFEEGKLEVQSVTDARADPPRGFLVPSAVPPAAPSATGTAGSADTWRFEVFISHAGEDKPFARELRKDINSLGLRAFVDMEDLLPGDQADGIMLGSANSAPVGLAVFSSDFFRKKWPMRELRILVERKTLLPVLYRDMPYDELERQLKDSIVAEPPKEVWDSFVEEVQRTTYLRSKEEYTGVLRQDLCWNVVRLLATKVCRTLPNSVRTGNFLDRVEKAAQMICDDTRFEDLPRSKSRQAEGWIEDIKALRRELMAA